MEKAFIRKDNVTAWGGDVSMDRTVRRLTEQPEVGT